MAVDLSKFIARFVEEARDHLSRLEEGLSSLEQGNADGEAINALFRSAHTVKGSARMLKLMEISETAHKLEDVLGALREGSHSFSPAMGQVMFRAVDALSAMVDTVDSGATLAPPDSALIGALEQVLHGDATGTEAPPPATQPITAAPTEHKDSEKIVQSAKTPPNPRDTDPIKTPETVRLKLTKLDELIKLMGEMVASHVRLEQRYQDVRRLEQHLARVQFPTDSDDLKALRNELHRFSTQLRDDVLSQELYMHELHDKALLMRMLPLTMVFDPAARLVRELARSLDREVEVKVSGAQIELDRQMIDHLSDPVVHLLRNAVDHGIETPEQRLAAGKPRQGRVQLDARQDGGWVVVEVSDDGKGLSLDAIRAKAVKKGIVSEEAAAELTDSQVHDLIFLPGFSTSAIITDISGRGVGMDVVKKTIVDELHGVISVDSHQGKGTSFMLRVPLSLAVMRVLLCDVDGFLFGLTAQYIHGLHRMDEAEFMVVAERKAVIIHNEFIPVVPVADLIDLPTRQHTENSRVQGALLVLVGVRSEKIALQVSELIDERDMVIKPLPEHLRQLPVVDGMVMTGRNELVSLLHVPELIARARATRNQGTAGHSSATTAGSADRPHILVVDDSLNTREIEKDVLETHGYRVTLAEDGLDGWQKARAGQFDAILTDVEMPGLDGFGLTERLRQDPRYRDCPIIIITSREKEEDKRRGIRVGADAYIVKGDFEQQGLIETLSSLLP